MKGSKFLFLLPVLSVLMGGTAHANWQYDGEYIGDGWYADDGARFTISVRGGASYGTAKIQNDVGALSNEYWYNPTDGMVITAAYYDSLTTEQQAAFKFAGIGELGDVDARENYSEFSFAAGASIGWVLPNRPQWRLELGWDHISESEYNTAPLFEGDMPLTGGDVSGLVIQVQSGAVQSKITTDIISAMVFYDFFDGLQKPTHTLIPYIGIGAGYVDSKTTLNLSDLYGDLSTSVDLQNFGKLDDYKVLQFYRSEHDTSTIAGVVSLGASYGLTETMFLDFGVRAAYVPRIKWTLTNSDNSRERDWFSAKDMVYINAMLGLRFEF